MDTTLEQAKENTKMAKAMVAELEQLRKENAELRLKLSKFIQQN